MSILVDTNVLLRQFEPEHAHHRSAVDSVTRLLLSAEPVHVTPQNISEFWAAATRSSAQNCLGLAVAVEPAIHAVLKRLVMMH